MTESEIVWGVRLILAAVFVVTAISKIADGSQLRATLSRLRIPPIAVAGGRWCIVGLELTLSVLLVVGEAFLAGMAVFLAFTGFIVVVLQERGAEQSGCGCAGTLLGTSPPKQARRVYWRVAGAGAGLLIAASAGRIPESPSTGAVFVAGAGVALIGLALGWRKRQANPLRGRDKVQDDADGTVSRRDVLRRTVTLSLGVAGFVLPFARAFACGGGTEFGCSPSSAADSSLATSESSAHSETDPCFKNAAVFKVTGDTQASDQFDECTLAAGVNGSMLLQCADAFRTQLIATKHEFEELALACA